MSYVVTIEGLDELRAAIKRSPATVLAQLEKGLTASALTVLKYADETNVPHRTGNLLRSFETQSSLLERKVGPNTNKAPYAVFVHEGTRPHRIIPRNKKALFWEGADHPVKSVNHPGTKANKYMPRILERATPEIQRGMKEVMEAIIQDLANK